MIGHEVTFHVLQCNRGTEGGCYRNDEIEFERRIKGGYGNTLWIRREL